MRQELAKVTGPTECGQVVLGHFEFPELENLIPNLATSATLVIAVVRISSSCFCSLRTSWSFLPLGSGEDEFYLWY